jgi:hypothetical protein
MSSSPALSRRLGKSGFALFTVPTPTFKLVASYPDHSEDILDLLITFTTSFKDMEPSAYGSPPTQDLSVENINPSKLINMLRARFGGSFKVHVRQALA